MAAEKYKLIYFNFDGLAESIRWMFAYSGVAFEDFRIKELPHYVALQPTPEWDAFKGKTPYGTLPLLEVDGKYLGETQAIARYVAKQVGVAGANDWDAAQADSIITYIAAEFMPVAFQVIRELDSEKKKLNAERAVPQANKVAATLVGVLEKNNEKNGKGFLVGQSPTVADFQTVTFSNITDVLKLGTLDEFKALRAHRELIRVLSERAQSVIRDAEEAENTALKGTASAAESLKRAQAALDAGTARAAANAANATAARADQTLQDSLNAQSSLLTSSQFDFTMGAAIVAPSVKAIGANAVTQAMADVADTVACLMEARAATSAAAARACADRAVSAANRAMGAWANSGVAQTQAAGYADQTVKARTTQYVTESKALSLAAKAYAEAAKAIASMRELQEAANAATSVSRLADANAAVAEARRAAANAEAAGKAAANASAQVTGWSDPSLRADLDDTIGKITLVVQGCRPFVQTAETAVAYLASGGTSVGGATQSSPGNSGNGVGLGQTSGDAAGSPQARGNNAAATAVTAAAQALFSLKEAREGSDPVSCRNAANRAVEARTSAQIASQAANSALEQAKTSGDAGAIRATRMAAATALANWIAAQVYSEVSILFAFLKRIRCTMLRA
ncbi:putative Glutathione S-transferase 1 [Hypsibius exemplaris]|uniref:glutathione transferase n=1 Tax=Hypsibius exemplaris TaxID=2072580 RepID=A0A1W0WEE8_HYPEX|nr:putative Glutathione S-transferase 1 [Hypsibius exemplaris]